MRHRSRQSADKPVPGPQSFVTESWPAEHWPAAVSPSSLSSVPCTSPQRLLVGVCCSPTLNQCSLRYIWKPRLVTSSLSYCLCHAQLKPSATKLYKQLVSWCDSSSSLNHSLGYEWEFYFIFCFFTSWVVLWDLSYKSDLSKSMSYTLSPTDSTHSAL